MKFATVANAGFGNTPATSAGIRKITSFRRIGMPVKKPKGKSTTAARPGTLPTLEYFGCRKWDAHLKETKDARRVYLADWRQELWQAKMIAGKRKGER